jgi:hypothetical protein
MIVKRGDDGFWAWWVLFVFLLAVVMTFTLSGCESEVSIKIVSKEEKDKLDIKELSLPEQARNLNKLDDSWHTFEITIDGKTRKILRRYTGVDRGGNQWQNATDAFTELSPQ